MAATLPLRAAQSLVRPSYRAPLEAWSSNVLGTANVLEACRLAEGVAAVVVVTTDKVYANREWPWGYRESDELAGHDPYSASKAATELLCDSYRKSFWHHSGPLLATARAGNVIGGGDWTPHQLVPAIIAELRKQGADDIIVFVGGVIPRQDYEFLYEAGVKGIYGPGTPIPASAKDVLEQIRKQAKPL